MNTVLSNDIDALPGERAYRAYRLNTNGGIGGVEYIEAANDDEARAIAAGIVNGHGVDLWERSRFLGCFPALSVSKQSAEV